MKSNPLNSRADDPKSWLVSLVAGGTSSEQPLNHHLRLKTLIHLQDSWEKLLV
ncbi:hypothetical protein [Halothece sp. PCC 7418]|uniref:hypothetical protein n=1 Tax=Halothece sp. (strain PCC 7418) TaxID=65093 RepID=UPI0014941644|nr:hypothetical protein [Halothece sp. PCC 7418]